MPIEDYWRIDNGEQQLPLDGHPGAEVTHNPGSSYTLDLIITDRSDSPSGAWPDAQQRWRTLKDYQVRQGEYALHEPMGGGVAYTETHDGAIPAGSLLVALRPASDNKTGTGMWALVAAVEDQTTLPSALYQISVELLCLVPLPAYSSFNGVRDTLAREGIGR